MKFKPYPKYKDSGIIWLGEIPEGWQVKKLGFISTILSGHPFQSTEFSDDGVPIIRMSDFADGKLKLSSVKYYPDDKVPSSAYGQEDDILIGLSGSLENYALIQCDDLPVAINQRVGIIRNANQQTQKLTYWFIQSNSFSNQIRAILPETTIVNVSMSDLTSCKVSLPPLHTQIAIAAFLDAETARIDGLIKDYEDLIELLKEKRQALISHAVTRGLSELVSPDDPEFGEWSKPVKFKDSGVEWIGEIPEGWGILPLKHVVNFRSGYAFPSKAFSDEGIPVIRISNITPFGAINFDNTKCLPSSYRQSHKDFLIYNGDLIMAMTGATIGKLGKYELNREALLNQRVCAFSGSSRIIPTFLQLYLSSSGYQDYIKIIAFGGAQPNISETQLTAFPIGLPRLPEQNAIASYLDLKTTKLDSLISESQSAIELLKEHRSALITNAVTGKINVEAHVTVQGEGST